MKIPQSIRSAYFQQLDNNKKLQDEIDQTVRSIIEKDWFYFSRVKELESFALKVESGRFEDINHLEDFFGCTIVVKNRSELPKALSLIKKNFDLDSRKPRDDQFTHKKASDFPFDDIRLYLKLKPAQFPPDSPIIGIRFEMQVKTFLQHAWGIATHDLVYKSGEIDWSLARITYQIKAMLEHAELTIEEAQALSKSAVLPRENRETKSLKSTIKFLKSHWKDDDLPSNLKSLAENIISLCSTLGIDLKFIESILEEENKKQRGVNTLNLSPYGIIVQSLFYQASDRIIQYIEGQPERFRIFMPREIELPTDFPGITSVVNQIIRS